MAFPEKSILIVGGGIVGLCLGVLAQARGFQVTLVSRDDARDSASGVAAGMIAPALEALADADPLTAFQRLKTAQGAWIRYFDLWPEPVQHALAEGMAKTALYTWESAFNRAGANETVRPLMKAMGAPFGELDYDALSLEGFDPEDESAIRIKDDWLVEASTILQALAAGFAALGGERVNGTVASVASDAVILTDGREWRAAHVVVAGGYGSSTFAVSVPSLKALTPIKGHLLDLPGRRGQGVIRSARGYLADYGASAKFGASMEPGRDDLAIDPTVVADLKGRAQTLFHDISLDAAVPRAGIRASTPDGWPLIGLDVASGVWVAVGMRRNGYVFAPFAAEVILDRIEGAARSDADVYDPQRFA